LPQPDKDRTALPPFDPQRPILLPAEDAPAEPERHLPHGEVPEPGTFWLLGISLGLLAWRRRRSH
jgi:hypothetical protein